MELFKIADSIYLIPGKNRGRFPFSHAIYVDGERKLLFDSGAGPEVMRAFLEEHKVDVYIASHAHPGHNASLHLLAGTPIFVPILSMDTFGNLRKLGVRFVKNEEARKLWMTVQEKLLGFKDTPHTHVYDAQTCFDLGSLKFDAIHTPGHTADHCCFFEEHTGTLLAFDIDLSPAGPFYVHHESNPDAYEASLVLLKSYKPSCLVSSHMGVLRSGISEAIDAFGAHIVKRDNLVRSILKEPLPIDKIVDHHLLIPDYPRNMEPIYREWERNMVHKHLSRMMDKGVVSRTTRGYQAC